MATFGNQREKCNYHTGKKKGSSPVSGEPFKGKVEKIFKEKR